MRAALRGLREARVEQIHEPGLAAPDAAPEVDALRRAAPLLVSPRSSRLPSGADGRLGELGAQAFELRHRRELRRVGGEAAFGDLLGVEGAEDVWWCDSQQLVVGAGSALGRHPVDDLVRVLDVAGLAVHAIGGVDVQPLAARPVVDHLVDARRGRSACRDCRIRWRRWWRRCSCRARSGARGCTSSCAVTAKNTDDSRSRGGRSRFFQCRFGDS